MTPDYDTARATVLAELGRADSKAAALLAALGLPLSVLIVTVPGRHLPLATTILGGLGALALATSAMLALLVLRPNLTHSDGTWAHWADCKLENLPAALTHEGAAAAAVICQSNRARTKYRVLRASVDAAATALALLAAALIAALV